MLVYIGADHRGFELKEKIKSWLSENGYQVEDLGATHLDPDDDYPQFAGEVAKKISSSDELSQDRGIVICGSGVGVDIVANKFDNVRSCLGSNTDQVKAARKDDDVNVLALAADTTDENTATQMAKAFLDTEYEDIERRNRRLNEIREIEENN